MSPKPITEFERFPDDWEVLPFLDAFSDKTSGNRKIKKSDYAESGILPIVDQGAKEVAGFVEDASLQCGEELPCILFGDHTRLFKYVNHPFALGADGVKVLVPKDGFDKRFLVHYLRQLRLPNAGYSRHFKFLKETYVPRPTLKEQQRIAAILDKANAIHRKRQKAIDLVDEFLRAVFLEMFGDPATNPNEWKIGTIRDLVEEAKYGTSLKAGSDGEFEILRMGNITYKGGWDFSEMKRIDIPKKGRSKYLVKKGDLLFNRTNSKELVGKTAVYRLEIPMAFAGYLVRIRTNRLGTTDYISAYMNSNHGKKTLRNMCKSIVGMANINAQEVQNIPIAIPPIKLQLEFGTIVRRVLGFKNTLEGATRLSEELFASLSQRAFVGEL